MKIAVLTGGSSSERAVALASTSKVVDALRSRGHAVTVADTITGILDSEAEAALLTSAVGRAPDDEGSLAEAERGVLLGGLLDHPAIAGADLVFLGLHGGRGEDGTIQHLLDLAGIRYTGSGALSSGLAMDKDLAKQHFRHAGVPVADWLMHVESAGLAVDPDVAGGVLGWPVVVKPSRQGSTVGLSVVHEPALLHVSIREALRHDDEVMVEKFIPGRELTVGILGDDPLAVGEIIPRHDLFDYECKYTPGMSEEIFPAPVPDHVAAEVRQLALLAHRAVKASGYSRVDFRLAPDGGLFCLELNTLPGLTGASLMPQSAAAMGIDFAELCERICSLALMKGR